MPGTTVTTTPVNAVTRAPSGNSNATGASCRRSRSTGTGALAVHSRSMQPSNGQAPSSSNGSGGPSYLTGAGDAAATAVSCGGGVVQPSTVTRARSENARRITQPFVSHFTGVKVKSAYCRRQDEPGDHHHASDHPAERRAASLRNRREQQDGHHDRAQREHGGREQPARDDRLVGAQDSRCDRGADAGRGQHRRPSCEPRAPESDAHPQHHRGDADQRRDLRQQELPSGHLVEPHWINLTGLAARVATLGDFFDHLAVERRDVSGLPRRDDALVHHHFLVYPLRARVDEIGFH